jgi:hypothetical protein
MDSLPDKKGQEAVDSRHKEHSIKAGQELILRLRYSMKRSVLRYRLDFSERDITQSVAKEESEVDKSHYVEMEIGNSDTSSCETPVSKGSKFSDPRRIGARGGDSARRRRAGRTEPGRKGGDAVGGGASRWQDLIQYRGAAHTAHPSARECAPQQSRVRARAGR